MGTICQSIFEKIIIFGSDIMTKKKFKFIPINAFLLIIVLGGCATIPQETIELSYVMEENIAALKTSYIAMVNTHFDLLEQIRIDYLEKEWLPKFCIKEWINVGRLTDIATGKVIWSEELRSFIQPEKGKETEGLLTSMTFWTTALIEQIEEKRKELISPLEDQRKELLFIIEEGFDRLLRGNMAITAHLNSIRKIEEFQNKTFEALKFGDLQKEIDKRLHDISRYTDQELEAVRKADGFIDTVNSRF